jgi:cytidylate kinase
MNAHPAITLSRSLGSGGVEVGVRVAKRLGWRFCDRRILRQAAENLGIPVADLRCQEERPCGFFEQVLRLTAFASPELPYCPPLDLPTYSRELFAVERSVMFRLVQRESAVLLGRGGFIALKDHPAVLHVSLQAPPEARIQHLLERGKAESLEAARRLIERSDRERAAFIRAISGLDWQDPGHFHLVLDPLQEGLEACSERIVAEAKRRFA